MKPPAATVRPGSITRTFQLAYGPNNWLGHSGKASWYPDRAQLRMNGGQLPAGATAGSGVFISGGAQMIRPRKPKLMMDPSDPSTWQRPYRFTGGPIG